MTDSFIQVEGLTRCYGELAAVDRASFAVAPVSAINYPVSVLPDWLSAVGLNVLYLVGVVVFRTVRRRRPLINVGE